MYWVNTKASQISRVSFLAGQGYIRPVQSQAPTPLVERRTFTRTFAASQRILAARGLQAALHKEICASATPQSRNCRVTLHQLTTGRFPGWLAGGKNRGVRRCAQHQTLPQKGAAWRRPRAGRTPKAPGPLGTDSSAHTHRVSIRRAPARKQSARTPETAAQPIPEPRSPTAGRRAESEGARPGQRFPLVEAAPPRQSSLVSVRVGSLGSRPGQSRAHHHSGIPSLPPRLLLLPGPVACLLSSNLPKGAVARREHSPNPGNSLAEDAGRGGGGTWTGPGDSVRKGTGPRARARRQDTWLRSGLGLGLRRDLEGTVPSLREAWVLFSKMRRQETLSRFTWELQGRVFDPGRPPAWHIIPNNKCQIILLEPPTEKPRGRRVRTP